MEFFYSLIADAVASAVNKTAGAVEMSPVSVVGDIGVPVGDDEVESAARVRAEALSAIHDAAPHAVGLVVLVHTEV